MLIKAESKSQRLPAVVKWMRMSQSQVLDKFQNLPGSFSDGIGEKRFVYVEGSRKDKVLLVVHADTVWKDRKKGTEDHIDVDFYDGILFSPNRTIEKDRYNKTASWSTSKKGIGIGADDRAGCAIVWALRELGHSILVTSGEEIGCVASQRIINSKYWENEINNNHQFAVQFDRHGKNDVVFYQCASDDFVDYVVKETKYKPNNGSFTDIAVLCRSLCGVNISVGYYDEHSSDERLVYSQYLNTLETARLWLSQPNLPKFNFDWKNKFSYWTSKYNEWKPTTNYNYRNYCDDYGLEGDVIPAQKKVETPQRMLPFHQGKSIINNNVQKSQEIINNAANMIGQMNVISCPSCGTNITQEIWFKNQFKCPTCCQEI